MAEGWEEKPLNNLAEIKNMKKRHGHPWTEEEDKTLVVQYESGDSIKDIAAVLERKTSAIRARLKKFEIPPVKTRTKARTKATSGSTPIIQPALQVVDADTAFRRFYFTYILVNLSGLVYVGFSTNIWKRIAQHNNNLGARATRDRGPWFPVTIYCFASLRDAMEMEASIKRQFSQFVLCAKHSFQEVIGQAGHPIDTGTLKLLQ